jgi:hypothetical protein
MPAICSARWLSGGSRTGVIAQCNSAVVATTVGLVGVGEVGIGAGRRGQWRLRIEPRLQPAPGSNQAGSGYDRDKAADTERWGLAKAVHLHPHHHTSPRADLRAMTRL